MSAKKLIAVVCAFLGGPLAAWAIAYIGGAHMFTFYAGFAAFMGAVFGGFAALVVSQEYRP